MKAIVLAGGNSSRMGHNKALMKLGNQPVIQYAIDNLSQVFEEVYISGNSLQYSFLGNCIEDSIRSRGPIGGIYSALKYCRKNIFVCSCDMPFIPVSLIEDILNKKIEDRINILQYKDKVYPTLGMYPFSALKSIKEAIDQEHLKMTIFLEAQNANYIHYKDNLDNQLMNLNTPENFHHAEQYMNQKIHMR